MSSKRKPLEWQFGYVATVNATVTNYRISLGLKDDQVAEVHKVDSSITWGNFPDAANDDIDGHLALSMDPDVIDSPAVAANHLDLEWFYRHNYDLQQEIGAAGQTTIVNSNWKISDFDPPVLVGTDIGLVVIGDAAIACAFWARVYFTRRKANISELNQVLLKRR